ncbi:hypothetical protein BJK31_19340 [Escherichia coli]|nr:hypothetical protein BJK31_19340 [Escherichia coli]OPJ03946.1 hypothetical protein BFQ15_03690 [Escherichia coli]
MLPSETMIWQPEFTDKTLSRKPGAVHIAVLVSAVARHINKQLSTNFTRSQRFTGFLHLYHNFLFFQKKVLS